MKGILMENVLEHSFILRRLKAIESIASRNSQIIKNGWRLEEIIENNERIVGELRDILLYAISGNAQPNPEYNENRVDFCNKECTDFYRESYRNFGHSDTPHGIDGMITSHIKQIATELLQARNCINRVYMEMYGIMGMQAGHTTATGEQQPQIFVVGMNKGYNLFEVSRQALTEAVNILCDMTLFTPIGPTEPTAPAIGGGNNNAT